jgi:transcriptional regulator with XRE-family HTH domain
MTAISSERRGSIRERREAAGLSRERLARLAECSTAMVVQIEQGYRPGRSRVLPRVERILDTLTPEEERRPGSTPTAAKAEGPAHATR